MSAFPSPSRPPFRHALLALALGLLPATVAPGWVAVFALAALAAAGARIRGGPSRDALRNLVRAAGLEVDGAEGVQELTATLGRAVAERDARLAASADDAARLATELAALRDELGTRTFAARRLEHAARRYRAAFERAATGMYLLHPGGIVGHANGTAAALLGRSPADLSGQPFATLLHAEDRAAATAALARLEAGASTSCQLEQRLLHADGHALRSACHVTAVDDGAGRFEFALVQVEDTSAARQLSRELSWQATHDAVTGLVNRREFEARLEFALESAARGERSHALCYLDLDQFKVVNDTCGHLAGDELLRQVGALLRARLRTTDTIARLGGDEFGVLMESCVASRAERMAEQLRAAVEGFQFAWDEQRFRLTASVGVAIIDDDAGSVTDLMRQADAACYTAKDLGRNRVHRYAHDDAELARRHGEMQWVGRIQHALDHDRFRLYIQPIVPLGGAGDGHYEVLLRMLDEAGGGDIPPGAFLPAAERYGLAPRVDRWVLAHLLEWLAAHPRQLAALGRCSVNLSGLTLADAGFLPFVVGHLASSGVPGSKLCFEITETALISNMGAATGFISALEAHGCRFALDDFGSGLSSFGYLKHLPVHYLKIDGMFVRQVHLDPIDRALVRSINDVGKVMGKETIAEFAEHDAILAVLRDLGVDYAQGYGVGRPFPLDELAAPPLPLAAIA